MYKRVIVESRKSWEPYPGDKLEGTYRGSRFSEGLYGGYLKHRVLTPDNQLYFLSGIVVDDLFEAVDIGAKIKVIYKGLVAAAYGNKFKSYELYEWVRHD